MQNEMSTLFNKHDTLEHLMDTERIRIHAIDVHADTDLLLIILNTGSVLQEKISKYLRLQHASSKDLLDYRLNGSGTAIHWPALDEDLSLKVFLRDTIKTRTIGNKVA